MNVTMEKTGDVSARLTVEVSETDYQEKVTKELKRIGQTHALPGFRKGHVPFAELKRRFGEAVTSDVINQVVYTAVTDYIRDNSIAILGEPLPVEVKTLDLKHEKEFKFQYDMAIAPDLGVKIDESIHVPYYTISVSDGMIDEQDKALRRRYGAQVPGEVTEPDALIKGVMMQLNEDGTVNDNEGAIQVTDAIVGPAFFKSKDEAAKFENRKVGDKVVFNPWNTCDGNPAEMASMLHIDKAFAGDVKSDFELAISEIIVVKPAELGEEYYTTVFGKDKVHDENEYREAVKSLIARDLSGNSEMMFRHDAQELLMEKYGEMPLADDLLKRWLVNRNEELTPENIDEEYTKLLPGLKWQLISERIAEQGNVKVTEENLLGFAKARAAQQFASYGMLNLDDEIVTNYAKQMLGDKEFRGRLVNQLGEILLFDALKKMISLDNKEVSLDEFKKIAGAE